MQINTLVRYVTGISSPRERTLVERWLDEAGENREILDNIDLIYNTWRSRDRIRSRDSHAALKKVMWRIRANSIRKAVYKIGVAVSIAAGVTGSFFIIREYAGTSSEPVVTTLTSAEGIRSRLSLPDGTKVCMNSGSTISYTSDFGKRNREVTMSGEVFFFFLHDRSKPFIVNTSDRKAQIAVLGTEFNVLAYPGDSLIQTALVNGSIRINFPDRNLSMDVVPDEMVTYNPASGKIGKEKTDVRQVMSWTEGNLVFRDTPMPDVFRQLSHFYGIDFTITDTDVLSWSFTGTFRNVSLPQILEYLRISSGLSYRTEGNDETKNRIIVSKEAPEC